MGRREVVEPSKVVGIALLELRSPLLPQEKLRIGREEEGRERTRRWIAAVVVLVVIFAVIVVVVVVFTVVVLVLVAVAA